MDDQTKSALLEIIKDEKAIQKRVSELSEEIDNTFKGEEIVVIGILKGAVVFMSDLVRAMKSEVICDFLGTSGYTKEEEISGEVKITLDLNSPVKGRNVLIVEDIASNALTLRYVYKNISSREPKTLKTCCFIKKESKNENHDFKIDFIGFKLPSNLNVVGYGIDFEGKYRNLPYVAKV
jgi:hypoxanthine phosphoribosyltransferase